MNKFGTFALGFALLGLASCATDEPKAPGNISDGETKFMAVSITTALENAPMTRAEGDEETPTPTTSDYEHGLAVESAVNTLDFYFFDANGNATSVKADGTNHLSVDKYAATDSPENENISNAIEAVLVISTKEGDAIPEQIVAVINKESGAKYAGLSIAQLQNELTEGKFRITKDNKTVDSFVMTNSVYASGNTLQVGAHVAGHLFSDEDDAMENPVTIYVERTLAKIRTKSGITTGIKLGDIMLYDPQDEKGYGNGEDNTKLYVKFLGWNTTAVSAKNRLVKVIDPLWNPGWLWNTADYHRSFWAVNADGNTYDYFQFDPETEDGTAAVNPAFGFTDFDGKQYTYLKENAGKNMTGGNPGTPSQVIIAAQIVDAQGNPVEFAEWAFQRMTVEDLKIAFANAATLYTKEVIEVDGNKANVMTKIKPEDIVLKTATAAGYTGTDKTLDNGGRRCLVYAALSEEAAKKTWYDEARLDATAINDAAINKIFFGLGGAKVYTEGRTYFYFDINHLAAGLANAEFGQKGVVRNHVYDATVKTLKGLGTPVYDPFEKIIPEKPSDEDTFIAAEIKVLSWRVVNFGVDLDWTTKPETPKN